MAKSSSYLGAGLPLVANLVLCFFLGWVLSCVDRFARGEVLLGILALPFLFGGIFWIVDFIGLIVNKNQIKWLAKL